MKRPLKLKAKAKSKSPSVGIVMGSNSDLSVMKEAAAALDQLGVAYEMRVVSAHRTPDDMAKYAKSAARKGVRVIIAGAGGAAHLPGMIASYTELPVVGVPVPIGALQGQDALLSIVQMPKGVPVATVAIGNAYNAGVLAAQILASGGKPSDKRLSIALRKFKDQLRKKVRAMKI